MYFLKMCFANCPYLKIVFSHLSQENKKHTLTCWISNLEAISTPQSSHFRFFFFRFKAPRKIK